MSISKEKYPHLTSVATPEQLKALPPSELPALAQEVRRCLIETVSENGGHLASNLGVVELTIALHRVFNCPDDHIIWDVGHQSYVHKLFTDRQERFDTLRRPGGLSGFTKRAESACDCFGAGHSSTSLSAALGFAVSDRLQGSDRYTVAVVGDGAFTGGMIHEALNNCEKNLHLVMVLNENEMSISKNIGRFARSLSRLRLRSGYLRTKAVTGKVLRHIPFVGKPLFRAARRMKIAVKDTLYGSNYFEDLGLYYIGPVDGNNEAQVEQALAEAKRLGEAVVVHVKTKKGKGYAPAENSPCGYHGVTPGVSEARGDSGFSARMGEYLTQLAKKDPSICAITAAMGTGTGLEPFRKAYPNRFFDVGIAEEHAVTFAAGLAANGKHPVFAVYSTFLQRAYDQLIHDVALQQLSLTLCIDRAGRNAADGPTHNGVFDVAFLSQIPNCRIYAPVSYEGLRVSVEQALKSPGITAVRYPSGKEIPEILRAFYGAMPISDQIGIRTCGLQDTPDAVVAVHGRLSAEVLKAKKKLAEQGVRLGIILCEIIKPYDELARRIAECLPEGSFPIFTAEEEIRAGGFGMCLCDAMSCVPKLQNRKTVVIAPTDPFAVPALGQTVFEACGISAEQIAERVLAVVRGESV